MVFFRAFILAQFGVDLVKIGSVVWTLLKMGTANRSYKHYNIHFVNTIFSTQETPRGYFHRTQNRIFYDQHNILLILVGPGGGALRLTMVHITFFHEECIFEKSQQQNNWLSVFVLKRAYTIFVVFSSFSQQDK